jgi:cytochrome c biogenesis protein CcdA
VKVLRKCSLVPVILMIAVLIIFPVNMKSVFADNDSSGNLVKEKTLYYFWAYCPLCDEPEHHLEGFEDYPISIEVYEIVYNADNLDKYNRMREEVGIDMVLFPLFIYEDQYWIGYSEVISNEITAAIENSLDNSLSVGRQSVINLPLIGEINLVDNPILLTTVIIAFLDGFNPCSFFVLTFLLAIIVHSASRKRIFLVGITFLLVTSLVYGLFILGALNIMLFAAQLFWIRNLVAAIVIVLGLFAVKDYLCFKEGLSLSISESNKNKYYQQVRKVFYTKSVIPMITATAVMAMGIALVELPCTAGFPFIWTSIIAGLELTLARYFLLFIVYLAIYLSVELGIFLVVLIRMRSVKVTEERGRLLKLIAGCLMLILGLTLLLKPEYMENLFGLIIAFAATAVLILIFYMVRKLVKV